MIPQASLGNVQPVITKRRHNVPQPGRLPRHVTETGAGVGEWACESRRRIRQRVRIKISLSFQIGIRGSKEMKKRIDEAFWAQAGEHETVSSLSNMEARAKNNGKGTRKELSRCHFLFKMQKKSCCRSERLGWRKYQEGELGQASLILV